MYVIYPRGLPKIIGIDPAGNKERRFKCQLNVWHICIQRLVRPQDETQHVLEFHFLDLGIQ